MQKNPERSAYKIYIKRTVAIEAPFDLVVESTYDWTHFVHLHRKTIVEYRLLYKRGNREIFLYKGRWLYPFPFYDYYVVFREYHPEQYGYRNVYLNVKTGLAHYLLARTDREGETPLMVSDYLFTLPRHWRFFPRLFFWVFKQRMAWIMKEDNNWLYERMAQGNPETNEACGPVVPEIYDTFDDLFKEEKLKEADAHFEYRVTENFDQKKKEYAKKG